MCYASLIYFYGQLKRKKDIVNKKCYSSNKITTSSSVKDADKFVQAVKPFLIRNFFRLKWISLEKNHKFNKYYEATKA